MQPDVAAAVESTPIPSDVTLTQGRDDRWTYLLTGPDGRREWLGRSSMPTVSAEALYGECCYDGSNVALPGILSGNEVLVLAHRLPSQAAIFVVESALLHLRLAMQLYDYSALIDTGRVIFLDGGDLTASLGRFVAHHPGYELPRTLFTGAVRAAVRIAELQRRFEQAGEEALRVQSTALAAAVDALRGVEFVSHGSEVISGSSVSSAKSRAALVCLDQRLESLELGRRLGRGLSELGVESASCLADAPDQCNVIAGLHAIATVGADLVLSVNVGLDRWRGLAPREMRVGAIMLGTEAVPRAVVASLGTHDLVFAASAEVEREAIANGLPVERCRRFDPAVDDVVARKTLERSPGASNREFDVAVVADLPDDRASAGGVTLASHIALWNALRAAAARAACVPGTVPVEQLVRRAESDSGVRIESDDLRRTFVDAARTRILPAALARAAVASLRGADLRGALVGANWEPDDAGADARWGCIPSRVAWVHAPAGTRAPHGEHSLPTLLITPVGGALPRGREDTGPLGADPCHPKRDAPARWTISAVATDDAEALAESVGVCVFPLSGRRSVQAALDVTAAGGIALVRGERAGFESTYPQLASVASLLSFFRSGEDLASRVRSLLAAPIERVHSLRIALAREHTVSQRVQWMLDQLRGRVESG